MRKEIVDSIELEDEEENKFKLISLIWDRTPLRAGRRIRIAFLVLSLQQMMGQSLLFSSFISLKPSIKPANANYIGINLSVYYSTIIFSQVGLSPFLSQILAAAMNTVFAIGTIPTPWLIERWGRKAIMLWSAVGLLICMIVFVILVGIPNPGVSMQWGSVGILFVYNFLMGFGWMGVPWIYGPEVSIKAHNIEKHA
jgi:MFS family permease